MKTYAEKLKDKRWQKKRLELLAAANFSCQYAFHRGVQNMDDGTSLEIHHQYYQKGLEPWEYPDFAYLVCCHECHIAAQEDKIQIDRALAKSGSETTHYLAEICKNANSDPDDCFNDIARLDSSVRARRFLRTIGDWYLIVCG